MKIADVAEFYAEAGGGVRTYVDHKLRAGTAAGHEIVIVAPGAEDREEARLGGRIVWVKNPPTPGDPRYRIYVSKQQVHLVLDHEAPDVVEGSSVYGGGWFVASWPGSAVKSLIFHQDPVAVFGHSFLGRYLGDDRVDRLARPVWSYLKRLAARYDTTVVAGHWLEERLRHFGVERVKTVPFGIDPGPFRAARPDRDLRTSLLARAGLGPDAALLVCVSRHHPEKRLGTLIRAIWRLNEAQPVGLAIFGDGPLRSRIEAMARRREGVAVVGYTRDREELARAMASADALLHGSAAETYGLVVAEAIAAGLPLVVPDTGGAPEIGRTSVMETYRAGDAGACAAAIRRLLSRDREELRLAAEHSRAGPIRTLDDHFCDLFAHYAALADRSPTK